MRKDVFNKIAALGDVGLMNKSELARRLGCNRRTVNKYIEGGIAKRKEGTRKSVLEEFKSIIKEKVDTYGAKAMSVYKFIQKKGYGGSYRTVNNFVKDHKEGETKKATIRFETTPGLQAQVDWKERITMISRNGEKLVVNIFLIVLGYSRLKFIKLTTDKRQKTLLLYLIEAFKYIQGIVHEILFDNMSSVVDRENSTFKNLSLNRVFKKFAGDAGFEVITCRPYRAQTKGKVESLAKLVDRLKAYNGEFDTFEDLEKIVKEFNEDINNEVSQATNEVPWQRFKKEKEYLKTLPPLDCLMSYVSSPKTYKVSRESMILYKGKKYSVPTHFIGYELSVHETDEEVQIYYTQDLICFYKKSDKYLNYKKEHAFEILKSDALAYAADEEINNFIENNLKNMDILLE